MTGLFFFGLAPAMLLCLGFVLGEAVRATSNGRNWFGMVGVLAAMAILSWFTAIVAISQDPGRVIDWFLD